MKCKVLLILFLISHLGEGRKRKVKLNQGINALNNNYFTEGIYGDITFLEIEPTSDYKPKHIEWVKFEFLEKFPNLEKLWISFFDFGTIEEKFQYSEKLTQLNLDESHIKNIPEDAFANLTNLEVLNLGANEISVLCSDLLKNNGKLKMLIFWENKIKNIPKNFLSNLFELEGVSFQDNQIESLSADLFKDTRKLKSVDFERNKIKKLPPHIFAHLNLQQKMFSGNPCAVAIDGDRRNSDLGKCFAEWERSGVIEENDDQIGCIKPN